MAYWLNPHMAILRIRLAPLLTTKENDLRKGLDIIKSTIMSHTCLEDIFGSTSKPPNNIYLILILGNNAAI